MSPVTAQVVRTMGRRQFSIIRSLRQVGRSMESHPFERLPVSAKSAPADWGRQFRRVGSQAVIFFPGMALALGWPYLPYLYYDGRV
ncbi:unnamed protein product [Clonostachys solani]|uniref:Uncharacterized protein n=1 Tax=Clonostachys solani TaxID=160281 RepID=A0A9N9Z337_9HYPO|nr:unnamed protein product [Clonostachys solani]